MGIRGFGGRLALLVFLATLLGCASGQPVPYGDEELIISISKRQLFAEGDQAQVTVTMLKADGMPVLDNTRVLLNASAGYFLENQLFTVDGQGQTTFVTDNFVGDVEISASSGSVGADGSISVTVTVVESDNAPAAISAVASPSTVEKKGDQVQIRAYVYNSEGQPLRGKPVLFTSSFGSLASNGYPVGTDNTGRASDSLLVNHDLGSTEEITITVSCVDQTTDLTIPVVQNEAPTADFSFSPSEPAVFQDVQFISKASDPDGTIEFQAWQFGDGETSSVAQPLHVYETPGTYIVSLQVEDNGGSVSSTEKTITVSTGDIPEPDFSYSPNPIRVGVATVFDGSLSVDPDGTISHYEWNFGSGYVREGIQTTWVFESAGTATVTLRVTDDSGNRVAVTRELTVEGNIAPTAQIQYSPTAPKQGDDIQFYGNESTDEDGTINTYTWSFGDGTTNSQMNPTHSYTASGSYRVQLTVQDNDAGIGRTSLELNVSENEAPNASFYISPQNPSAGEVVRFNASESDDPDGTISRYTWDFGDGSSGVGMTATHAYGSADSYIVLLSVLDNDGATGTQQKTVSISEQQNDPPVASFTTVPATITVSTTEVLLDASATTDDNTILQNLTFSFVVTPVESTGGSTVLQAQIQNTANSFVKRLVISGAETGDYLNVVLTVIDEEGAFDSQTQNLQIQN